MIVISIVCILKLIFNKKIKIIITKKLNFFKLQFLNIIPTCNPIKRTP